MANIPRPHGSWLQPSVRSLPLPPCPPSRCRPGLLSAGPLCLGGHHAQRSLERTLDGTAGGSVVGSARWTGGGGVRGGATESRGSLAKDDPAAPLATEWVGRRGGSPHPLCRDRVDDAPVTDTRGPACGGRPPPSGLSDARATRRGAQGSRGPWAVRIGRHRRRRRHPPPRAPHSRAPTTCPQPLPS